MTSYKESNTIEVRLDEASKIIKKYPDKIPVIIQKSSMDKSLPVIDRNKYLIPRELVVGQLVHIVKKRIHITAEQAIFLFETTNSSYYCSKYFRIGALMVSSLLFVVYCQERRRRRKERGQDGERW